MDDSNVPGSNPEEAFSLIADEIRFGILMALWESEETPLPFSGLHDRVDVRDSGQFNYHLDKLTPAFVRQYEEGYDLTHAGMQIIGAAVSGTYTDADVTIDPVPVSECPDCGGGLEASYDRGFIEIECPDCDLVVTDKLPAPPVLAKETEPEDIPVTFGRFLITEMQYLNRDFCTLCGGRIEHSIVERTLPCDRDGEGTGGNARGDEAGDQPSETDSGAEDETEFTRARLTCRNCGMESSQVLGVRVLDHPAVVGFLYEHGIDIRETPVWEFDWLTEPHATVAGEEPLRIETVVEVGGDRLELVLDESLEVVDHRRGSSRTGTD